MSPTRHDASKVLMGATGSSDKDVSCEPSDPASFPAGRAVRRASTGALSLSSGDGQLIGVSLGKSLSDHKKTAVVRDGNDVPLELPGYAWLVAADLTFFKKVAAVVSIELVDTVTAGSELATVTGDAEAGWLISVAIEDGVSTATQVKAAIDAETDATALIDAVITGTAGDPQDALAEDVIDTVPVVGTAVRVNNTDGKAIPAGGTLTGAIYQSATLTGIQEDASEIPVAKIDMVGGL